MENLYVALENVRSLLNVGAIMRTCSFFGVKNLILCGYSGVRTLPNGTKILHEKLEKTQLKSHNDLNLTFLDTSADLIKFSKDKNLKIYAIEQNPNSTPLKNFNKKEHCILVFGNEVEGVSAEIQKAADKIIEINKMGEHNSLNVATTAGIVLYEFTN